MKALTYQSSKNVSVETVPDPVLEQEDDVLLRVTATAICGSDLHIFRGKIPDMESGDILGHEFIQAGDLKPEVIISHHMALEDAARGYDIFEKAEEECRKVVLTPSGPRPMAPLAPDAERTLPL